MSTILSERFEDALSYTARLHRKQIRKGTPVPYVSHLLGVASLAIEHGANEDEAIAALLHDAVEDQGGRETLDAIRERFGEGVAKIVDGCTDAYEIPKPPWRQRKEAYITHLEEESDSGIRLVSACDKLHNARSIITDYRSFGESLWSRFKGGRDGTLWYYRTLVTTFRRFGESLLVVELDHAVSELERRVSSGMETVDV